MKQHIEHLNKHKLVILKRMVEYANANNKNEIPLSILRDNINDYNNAQKLRYHALIFKVKRGTWGITAQGGKFLRGEIDLPKWVMIEDNHIVDRAKELVNIRQVYQGSTIVTTEFEYFDSGTPLGMRPLEPIRAVSWLKEDADNRQTLLELL